MKSDSNSTTVQINKIHESGKRCTIWNTTLWNWK